MRVFQAYAKNHGAVTANTPKEAAEKLFETFPKARKCNVLEGAIEITSGKEFFVTAYNRENWPQSFKDVTKKTAGKLVDAKAEKAADTTK